MAFLHLSPQFAAAAALSAGAAVARHSPHIPAQRSGRFGGRA